MAVLAVQATRRQRSEIAGDAIVDVRLFGGAAGQDARVNPRHIDLPKPGHADSMVAGQHDRVRPGNFKAMFIQAFLAISRLSETV